MQPRALDDLKSAGVSIDALGDKRVDITSQKPDTIRQRNIPSVAHRTNPHRVLATCETTQLVSSEFRTRPAKLFVDAYIVLHAAAVCEHVCCSPNQLSNDGGMEVTIPGEFIRVRSEHVDAGRL